MTSQIYACRKLLKRSLLTTFLLCGSCATLVAQGYVYTFEGFPGYQQLDGSFVVLSNTVPGIPTLADLLGIKILDSYGGGAVFGVSVSAQGFNVTSFGPQGFNGSISGTAQSYVSPTTVQFAGMDSTPGIYASNNGFFPGNPSGEFVLGIWVVTPIPEPQSLGLVVLGLAGVAFRLLPLRFGSGKDDSQDCNEITVQAYD